MILADYLDPTRTKRHLINKVHRSYLRDIIETINGSLVRVYRQRNWRVFRNPVVSLGQEYLPKRSRTRSNPKKKKKGKKNGRFVSLKGSRERKMVPSVVQAKLHTVL